MIHKLRQLIREVHRRSIWQVLGIYLAGSWAGFEVSRSLTETAGLPSWFPAFALALLVLGLPIVLATAFIQDGRPGEGPASAGSEDRASGRAAEPPTDGEETKGDGPPPEGDHVSLDATSSGGARRLFTWKTVATGGVGALAAWSIVAGVLLLGRTPEPRAVGGEPRVAVLPIGNLTGDPDRQFLADGLHDEVITRLQQVGGLRVTSRTSTLRYRDTDLTLPEIADELGVDALVEATLQTSGGTIRLIAQLVDGDTDEHLWANTFDRAFDPERVLTVQTDLALEVADLLAGQLSPGEQARVTNVGTASPVAQRQYLLGVSYRNSGRPEDLPASIAAFERALELDPDFALAHSALAESYMIIAHGPVPPWEAFPPGESAATAALAVEPRMAEALTILADVEYHYRWRWSDAEEAFERALELNPSHATAHWWLAGLLSTLRRHDEAVEHARTALPLDPRNVIARGFVARVLFWGGRIGEATRVLDEGLADDPNHPVLLEMKGTILLRAGDSEARRAEGLLLLERAASMGPPGLPALSYGAGLAVLGRSAEARSILASTAEPRDGAYIPRYYRAWVAAELGDRGQAMDLLEEAAEVREAPLIWLNIDPAFRDLHQEPRFLALLDRMGLAPGGPDV